jgi:hypothetical protein
MGHSLDRTGTVYFLDAFGSSTLTAEGFRDLLLARYQYWRNRGIRPSLITDEPLVGKNEVWEIAMRSWFATINQPMPPLITLQRGSTKKASRHMDAAQFILDGKVFFRRSATGLYGEDHLLEQLSQIGVSRHDDYIDAFSDAFHPKCYNVMHRIGSVVDEDKPIEFPFDSYLKGGTEQIEKDLWNILGQ